MGTRKPEDIRSVAIAAHGGAGKTSLVEAMLFSNGDINRMGNVVDGNTVADFGAEEQKRQISINTALVTLERNGKRLYLLDTPGFADFIGEMRSAMRVSDSALAVVSGLHGVEVQTGKAYEYAEDFSIPVAFVVSKLDRENSDYARTLDDIKKQLSDKAVPFFLPIGKEASFKGVVDILNQKAYEYVTDGSGSFKEISIPAEMVDEVSAARESLIESVVEADDEVMMMYLEGDEISHEEIVKVARKAIRERQIFPVLPASGTANIGVHQVLDFLGDMFPSPLESRPRQALKGDEVINIDPDPEAPFSALCFKIMVDPYVGKLSYIRVNSGHLSSDSSIYNVTREEEERISSFKAMRGKDGLDEKEIILGDIIAIPKLHSTQVGDTLGVKSTAYTFPPIKFPKPVYSVAVMAKSRADEDKLSNALHKILEEDPVLTFAKNPETGDNVLSGMGDMHIEILLSRIRERYGVELETRTPQVPYRETIRKTAEAQGKYKKQTGGRGQYGDVHIRYKPLERGAGFVFEDQVVGGAIPKSFIPAVEKGLREALVKGPLAGFPTVDFKAELFFGSYHDVDSSEMAFKIAASMSFKKGILEASPVLLEPIMLVEVVVPEDYLGDVMGDMNSRRGRILGIDSHGRLQVVRVQVPLSEMFKYAIVLRSMTSGRGTFTMEFDHYEEVPGDVSKKVIEEHKKEEEEE
ncbi:MULTISPECIES: elongation factor G [Aminobacterium]|jgi:elongation factor G|uniref:elongation factor G n=1 Tax=Aminobacterium TaxID=81466 RepID=UPI00257C7654|nr:elongation factor G [Aminobacterium sp. UBA4987]